MSRSSRFPSKQQKHLPSKKRPSKRPEELCDHFFPEEHGGVGGFCLYCREQDNG